MISIRKTALALALGVATATTASAQELTIAIVNNGHCLLYTSDAADE